MKLGAAWGLGWWLLAAGAACCAAAPEAGVIRGAARVHHPREGVLTWGSELKFWPLDGGRAETLLRNTNFGPGGCVDDVNGDGRDDLMVQERPGAGRFVWLQAPKWQARTIETETEFRDCLPFEFDDHKGVIIPHLHAQVRFYEYLKRLDDAWTYSELYSIYTASHQGGLLEYDVDGDGLADLFIGNYWMRNPGRWELPWRLFNMNTFFDTPDAALARFALYRRPGRAQPDLIWAESEGAPARLALLERPEDVKQQWPARLIEPAPNHPRALLVMEQANVWPLLLVGAEDGVRVYSNDGARWRMHLAWKGAPVIALFEAGTEVLAVTGEGVVRLKPHDYLRR